MRHWIFSCKQISRLISESMDRKLPLSRRMGIRFHLMMCNLCRRYKKQLLFIRSLVKKNDLKNEFFCQALPDDARKRIKKELIEKGKK